MKKKLIIGLSLGVIFVLALVAVLVVVLRGRNNKTADMNEQERSLLGKWAYIHDLDTKVAVFNRDGSAKFEGKKYESFSGDGAYIQLTDQESNTTKIRYKQSGDSELTVYIKSRYVLENGETPKSVEGVWVCPEKKWTFEFTVKGTFLEDGVLTGHYFVDEENGTILLVYEKSLEDTLMYYSLSEDGLFIEYPWIMQKTK